MMVFQTHRFQAKCVPEVDPTAQHNLRAMARDEIKERKGKGKGNGNKKAANKKYATAASSKTNQNNDGSAGGGTSKQPTARKGKGPAASMQKTSDKKNSSNAKKQDDRVLGCPTCRFSKGGCHICRRPGYKPRGPNKRSKAGA